jgi:hypothetical protein
MTTFKPKGMMSSGGGEVLQRVSPGGVSSRYIFRAVFSREYNPEEVFFRETPLGLSSKESPLGRCPPKGYLLGGIL